MYSHSYFINVFRLFWSPSLHSDTTGLNLVNIIITPIHLGYYLLTTRRFLNKQGIAETAKTNGPTCDNMCIQKI